MVFGIALACFALTTSTVNAVSKSDRIKVLFLAPDDVGFWHELQRFMRDVAKDLEIDLNISIVDSRFHSIRAVEDLRYAKKKPDYLVFHYQNHTGAKILKLTEELGIKAFMINTAVDTQNKEKFGLPREQMKHWIAHMFPDDRDSGYRLADYLVKYNKSYLIGQEQKNGRTNFLAIGGSRRSTSGPLREKGLASRISETDDISLRRSIFTSWTRQESERATFELLRYYQDISVIWTASDLLAEGAIAGAKRFGRVPGKDIFIGGIDWSTAGVNAVRTGELSVTFGGHYMEGGWSLVLINDYHHGIDFADELGVVINLPMTAITKESADKYFRVFGQSLWKEVDFKSYSKHFNPSLKHYDFSLKSMLNKFPDS